MRASGNNEVKTLAQIAQPEVGAPCPVVLAEEHKVLLAYFVRHDDRAWSEEEANPVLDGVEAERIAIVAFVRPYAHTFGPPNDEAFEGHPLYARGLRPWCVQEVLASPWIDFMAG